MAGPPVPPEVEEVVPGIWSIPVPIPVPGSALGYTLVYALETEGGVAMVDAGLNMEESFTALKDGLAQIGAGLAEVRGVAVTHVHPDHYGLAGRIREESGAWVALHPADAAMITAGFGRRDAFPEEMTAWLIEAGAPSHEIDQIQDALMRLRNSMAGEPDVLLEDGGRADIAGWEVVAVHTPGHSPGHLCYVEESAGVLFTGDHLLPGITPNVSAHPHSVANPLGDFLVSLGRLRKFAGFQALPAHQWRFSGLEVRIDEIEAHHLGRLDDIAKCVVDGAETAWEVAEAAVWSTPWEEIPTFMRRAAVGETLAHLLQLEVEGRVTRRETGPVRWLSTEGEDLPAVHRR
jgi:glyoxylase-like metal-dependent hydrolase (beta-lactamase superfamily II)